MVRRGQFGFDNGQKTYDLRFNCFGDLTFPEFATQYLGHGQLAGDGPGVFIDPNIDPELFSQRIVRTRRRDYHRFPPSLDWEERGKLGKLIYIETDISFSGFVTPVISQDPCNSCAAHSASSSIESCLAIASSE